MTHQPSASELKWPRALFVIAAATYLLGVVGYCLWIYYDHPIDAMEPAPLQAHARRSVATGFFLLITAILPMVALYRYAYTAAARSTAQLNAELKQKVARQKEREAELQDAIRDLERFNAVAVGRENRILELKNEVNTLLEQQHRQKRYHSGPIE
ncbi:MAG: hypothetical protein K9M54_06355 [Kiritimatiellales bacterium]|nr:hypothetical protein [Kiritimatiellales bacterium]MCF7863469.1 hypothetical protein [Kiritimatiellales bacterium]